MIRFIVCFTVLAAPLALKAQTPKQKSAEKDKANYSFVWGLFQSKDYPKNRLVVVEFQKPVVSTNLSQASDSEKYNEKSILWGAIKWGGSKNVSSPSKTQTNAN